MSYWQVDVSFRGKRSLIVEANDYAEADKVVTDSVVDGVEGFQIDQITELTKEQAMSIVAGIEVEEGERTLN